MHFVSQVHDMEFAPSLDIVVNETLPALQKVRQIESQNFNKKKSCFTVQQSKKNTYLCGFFVWFCKRLDVLMLTGVWFSVFM